MARQEGEGGQVGDAAAQVHQRGVTEVVVAEVRCFVVGQARVGAGALQQRAVVDLAEDEARFVLQHAVERLGGALRDGDRSPVASLVDLRADAEVVPAATVVAWRLDPAERGVAQPGLPHHREERSRGVPLRAALGQVREYGLHLFARELDLHLGRGICSEGSLRWASDVGHGVEQPATHTPVEEPAQRAELLLHGGRRDHLESHAHVGVAVPGRDGVERVEVRQQVHLPLLGVALPGALRELRLHRDEPAGYEVPE